MSPSEVTVDLQDEAALQLDGDGNLRHLLTLKGLHKNLLVDILDDAEDYLTEPGKLPARSDLLAGRAVADGPQSVITQQVTNGVAVRIAVLERVGRLMARR